MCSHSCILALIHLVYSLGSDGLGEEESTGIKNHDRLDDKQIEETFNKVTSSLYFYLSISSSLSIYVYICQFYFFYLSIYLSIFRYLFIICPFFICQIYVCKCEFFHFITYWLSIYQSIYLPITPSSSISIYLSTNHSI